MINSLVERMPEWSLWFGLALSIAGYLAIGIVSWYFTAGFVYAMNSGQLGKHWLWFPFQCFAEELPCRLANGEEARINFIKDRVRGCDGAISSEKRLYTHQEIREQDLYQEVFYVMKGSTWSFWLEHTFYVLGWPILLAIVVLVIAVNALLFCFAQTISGIRKITSA